MRAHMRTIFIYPYICIYTLSTYQNTQPICKSARHKQRKEKLFVYTSHIPKTGPTWNCYCVRHENTWSVVKCSEATFCKLNYTEVLESIWLQGLYKKLWKDFDLKAYTKALESGQPFDLKSHIKSSGKPWRQSITVSSSSFPRIFASRKCSLLQAHQAVKEPPIPFCPGAKAFFHQRHDPVYARIYIHIIFHACVRACFSSFTYMCHACVSACMILIILLYMTCLCKCMHDPDYSLVYDMRV